MHLAPFRVDLDQCGRRIIGSVPPGQGDGEGHRIDQVAHACGDQPLDVGVHVIDAALEPRIDGPPAFLQGDADAAHDRVSFVVDMEKRRAPAGDADARLEVRTPPCARSNHETGRTTGCRS